MMGASQKQTASNAGKICLTLDVDWAPEAVLAWVVARLEEAAVPATFFATHESKVLAALDREQFEVGLHPNFKWPCDLEQVVANLKTLYPDAVGGRSHALMVSSHILQLYRQYGLRYESNIFLPLHAGLHPVKRFEGFVSIPFYWSDDKHLEEGRPFDLSQLQLEAPGLKVLNFHPIHAFMNTHSPEHYAHYKQHYQNADQLQRLREAETPAPGIGTLFLAVLERLQSAAGGVSTLQKVCKDHLESQ